MHINYDAAKIIYRQNTDKQIACFFKSRIQSLSTWTYEEKELKNIIHLELKSRELLERHIGLRAIKY